MPHPTAPAPATARSRLVRIARRLGAAAWLLGTGALAAASLPDEVNSLLAAGRAAEALQRSEQALMVSPRDAQARFVHGVVLMELRRDAEALEQFERAPRQPFDAQTLERFSEFRDGLGGPSKVGGDQRADG
ncbi:MAG: tetratricopeptide repeat protein, partial [Betaproteobacteria bacterium]